jgi:transcriptional regulator with XRE-family HTH domain
LGRRLRDARQGTGRSLKRVAPVVGVNYAHLSKLENGAAKPSPALLERLAQAYDTDSDELFLAAGLIPPDVMELVRDNLRGVVEIVRSRYGPSRGS